MAKYIVKYECAFSNSHYYFCECFYMKKAYEMLKPFQYLNKVAMWWYVTRPYKIGISMCSQNRWFMCRSVISGNKSILI